MKNFLLKNGRIIIYVLLTVCSIIFFYGDLKLDNYSLFNIKIFERYGNGLATNIFSTLITFTVIDNLLNYYENQRNKKYRAIGTKLLMQSFWNLGIMFSEMIKVSLVELPKEPTKDIPSTLRADFALNIEHIDFGKSAPVIPERPWYQHSYETMNRSFNNIHENIGIYLPYLDIDLINKITRLEDNVLINFIKNAPVIIQVNEYGYTQFPMYNGNTKYIKEGLDLLADIFESLRKENDLKLYYGLTSAFWNPSLGAARVDDLRAPKVFSGIEMIEDTIH